VSESESADSVSSRERGLGAWGAVIQVVSTFGLAVFLVLYYVLVMQPKEQARYEELRRSVDTVVRLVEEGQTLVSREEGARLEELYVLAVAPELAARLEQLMPSQPTPQPVSAAAANRLKRELQEGITDALMLRVRLLRGLSYRDGGDLAEVLTQRIRSSGVAEQLAARVVLEWPYGSRDALVSTCREALYLAFHK
jgi:hypothetical protein